MVKKAQIEQLINTRLNRVLLYAETSLHPSQFQAFRKLTLDEFGNSGLAKELERIFNKKNDKAR